MEIAILGMGRLGRSLALSLTEVGYHVHPWRRGEPIPAAEVTWITVPDEAVAEVARLVPTGTVVLHASGRLGTDVLAPHHPAGSLHPAQTFPGPEVRRPDLSHVAAAIAGDPEAMEAASRIALSLGMMPIRVPGDRRLYHAACVLAGNFVTLALAAADEAAREAGVDPAEVATVLGPLARQSLDNALASLDMPRHTSPIARSLTGPFARGDAEAIARHREALALSLPHILPMYDALGTYGALLRSRTGEART